MRHIATRVVVAAAVSVVATVFLAGTAQARRSTPTIYVTSVRPYQPGDKLWTVAAPLAQITPYAIGCQRVPSSGYIGQGVFAQTTQEYASSWQWGDASSALAFTWYVKKTDGTTQTWGSSSGSGGSATVPANIYYWQVQNNGSTPQAWNVCYSG